MHKGEGASERGMEQDISKKEMRQISTVEVEERNGL